MKIPSFAKDAQRFLDDNAPAILTGMAVVGTGMTAWFSHKAATQSRAAIDAEAATQHVDSAIFDVTDKAKLVWQFYIPPAACVVGTSACMIMATKIGLNRTAAMAGALAVSQRAYSQYEDKVKEVLGENKHVKVRDAVATDAVNAIPENKMIMVSEGKQAFLDLWSGRLFESTMEDIKKAMNEFNHELLYGSYSALSQFYNLIGLDSIRESDDIGWSSEYLMELVFTTVLKDGKAVVAFDFDPKPKAGFSSPHP